MKLFNSIFFILCLGTLMGCEYYDNKLTIINKSNVPIAPFIRENNSFEWTPSIDLSKVTKLGINPNEKESLDAYSSWERTINLSPNKKIYIFFVSPDTIKKYAWDTLFKNKMYLQVDSFDLNELKEKNWEVAYIGKN